APKALRTSSGSWPAIAWCSSATRSAMVAGLVSGVVVIFRCPSRTCRPGAQRLSAPINQPVQPPGKKMECQLQKLNLCDILEWILQGGGADGSSHVRQTHREG